jgi:hypothetical protein
MLPTFIGDELQVDALAEPLVVRHLRAIDERVNGYTQIPCVDAQLRSAAPVGVDLYLGLTAIDAADRPRLRRRDLFLKLGQYDPAKLL